MMEVLYCRGKLILYHDTLYFYGIGAYLVLDFVP